MPLMSTTGSAAALALRALNVSDGSGDQPCCAAWYCSDPKPIRSGLNPRHASSVVRASYFAERWLQASKIGQPSSPTLPLIARPILIQSS